MQKERNFQIDMLSFISDHPGKHERRGILPFLRYDALRYVFFLLFLLLIVLLTGCSAPDADASDADQDTRGSDTLTVLCVDFPEYDWTRILVGTAAEASPGGAAGQATDTKKIVVQLLNTGGADLHSYQPTIADMVKIANCDLLIYNGGASQFWVADALQAYPDPHRQVLSMMELFETQPERFPTYTQDEEHDHDHEHVVDDLLLYVHFEVAVFGFDEHVIGIAFLVLFIRRDERLRDLFDHVRLRNAALFFELGKRRENFSVHGLCIPP